MFANSTTQVLSDAWQVENGEIDVRQVRVRSIKLRQQFRNIIFPTHLEQLVMKVWTVRLDVGLGVGAGVGAGQGSTVGMIPRQKKYLKENPECSEAARAAALQPLMSKNLAWIVEQTLSFIVGST
jgi:hypothetical protein